MHICKFFCLILVHSNTFQAFVMYYLVYQLQCSSIKFCSYNYVLNEVPNNNDITCIENMVLNEVPNSNDATHVVNNMRLTTMGVQQFSIIMAAIQSALCRKVDLSEKRDDTKTIKVHADGNKLCPGKEWRLYTQQFRWQVNQCGQAVKQKISRFHNFNLITSKAQLSCLNRFMVLLVQQKEIYGLYLKEMLL